MARPKGSKNKKKKVMRYKKSSEDTKKKRILSKIYKLAKQLGYDKVVLQKENTYIGWYMPPVIPK